MEGWVKLHRKVLRSPAFDNPYLFKVWCWCLCKASSKPFDAVIGQQTVHLEKGQFVFGLIKASEELDIPKTTLSRYLKKLKKMGNVGIKTTNKYSILTVENWDLYQCNGIENNSEVGNKWETNGNIQEYKEYNKKIYGEFQNVRLSEDEISKLKKKYPSDYQERIETLSSYKKSKGRKYKSDYATILNWARREAKDLKEGVEKIDW